MSARPGIVEPENKPEVRITPAEDTPQSRQRLGELADLLFAIGKEEARKLAVETVADLKRMGVKREMHRSTGDHKQ